jgi:uncharacterized protein (DUF885 family)
MRKIQSLFFICRLAGVLCCALAATGASAASVNAKAPTTTPKAAPTAGQFDQLVDDFVLGTLALSPTTATSFGYHVHHDASLDDMLDDFSPAGIAASRSFLLDIEARIKRLDTTALDAEQRADIEIMQDALGASRLELDEIQGYRHKPSTYVEILGNGLYSPYVLQYAPAPERYRHIINRLNKVPEFIRQAEANLQDSPEVWNRVAREENEGNVGLIDQTLRADCPLEERMRYDQAAARAIAALNGFNHWLENNLAEKTSEWRLGKELYAKKFRLVLETGKTPEELLAEAEGDLVKARAEIARLAAPKTVEQALADVARQHASAANFMSSAKQALASATAFVKSKDLVTLPPNANLEVIETPVFMRGLYGVGGFNPAPALEPKLGAFFWVTPIRSCANTTIRACSTSPCTRRCRAIMCKANTRMKFSPGRAACCAISSATARTSRAGRCTASSSWRSRGTSATRRAIGSPCKSSCCGSWPTRFWMCVCRPWA